MASEKPSAWAMDMSRHYAACSSAMRSVGAEELAFILDAAREQGRNEREAEIVKWLRSDADARTEEANTRFEPCWPAIALRQAAIEIERGAGRKEDK